LRTAVLGVIATLIGSNQIVDVLAAAPSPAPARATVSFDRDIRSILSEKCFACHGPDVAKRKGKLRLDTQEGAYGAAASGSFAVVPNKLEESELYIRITSDDPDERMPPAKTGKPLTAAEIQKLTAWIEQGAEYQRHWAFIPPVRPEIPNVQEPGRLSNPIDFFIVARLQAEGLKLSPESDRTTLIRRLSLDLRGLPPTIAEVDAFLADRDDGAYERLVDRLLDSPHYGERWGRIWLDAARYADSDGYEKDKLRRVHFYRDWVVDALNRDIPYNQFVIEQIAGDELPNPTQDQIVATGFLRNSMVNEEGGIDPEQFRMEAMFDRMDCIGKSVLGLTIQCAQCHTHKFDPLTHEEYYRMFAFLNDAHEANTAVYSPDEQMRRAEMFRRIREIEADLKHRYPDWQGRMAAWERTLGDDRSAWRIVSPPEKVDGGQKHYTLGDGSVLAAGYAPTKHTTEFTVKVESPTITAVRLEMLNDPSLPLGGPGRSIKGQFGLSEFRVDAGPLDGSSPPKAVAIARASADVNPPERPLEPEFDDRGKARRITGPISFAIDGKRETAWTANVGAGRSNVPRNAVFVFEKPVTYLKGTELTFHLDQYHGGWNSDDNQNNNLGRFRFSVTDRTDVAADPVPKAVREILAVPADKRSPAQSAVVFAYWRTTVPEWKEANDRIEALWNTHPVGSEQLVLHDLDKPRVTHLLQRGDFLKPGKEVGAGTPAFLNPLPEGASRSRLTFARWLVDRNAPTTARSLVNRVWQAYFGIGIVSTSEDLGTQSEAPSHPALLDWLAVEVMDGGWRLKQLHRLIVTSATYRQSSRVSPELLAKDPYNRLLARGPRFRVDAEIVRDVALAASGLLNPKLGGPSIQPPAPAFLFLPPASYGPKVWNEAAGPDRYRRALYTFRYRSVPYPMLQAFDAPNGDFSCVRRARSNTPLQALTTLNEPVFLECARALALLILNKGGGDDASRIDYAFRRCLARKPTKSESNILLALLERQLKQFATEGHNPWDLVLGDPSQATQLPPTATPAQWASWTAVSRVLLNLDETVTKE
jgi:hypothetical protein